MLRDFLLLSCLSSCVCGKSVVNYIAPRYQGEEGGELTATWNFSKRNDIAFESFKIHCQKLPEGRIFFHLDNGVEEPQHDQFAGRVQIDRDAVRRGCVRLRLSRITTSDSGLYLCRMADGPGRKSKHFYLNVTKAADKPEPPTPTYIKTSRALTTSDPVITETKPPSRHRICLYAVLGGITVAVLVVGCCISCCKRKRHKRHNRRAQDDEVL